jgi:osmotically-inducible protein OsmY
VTLHGRVPTWFARNAALQAAQFTDGVTEVVDELSIEETF